MGVSDDRQIEQGGRWIAWRVLRAYEQTGRPIQALFEAIRAEGSARAHAFDLVCGVLRNRVALGRVLEIAAQRPIGRFNKRARPALEIAAYEWVYRPETPDYAVVSEAVTLARHAAGRHAGGFANAVLRNLERMTAERCGPWEAGSERRWLPQTAETGCRFTVDVLPATEPAGPYLAAAFSLPSWLVAEWVRRWGVDKTRRVCLASNRRPGIYLQPNTLRTTAAALAERLEADGIHTQVAADGRMLRLDSHVPIRQLDGYEQGLFTVQDPTAAMAAKMAGPEPGQIVVDWCAAPGGKTARMAQLMGDRGMVLACDADAERLAQVETNVQRLGLGCVRIVPPDRREAVFAKLDGVDVLLLDVPCSNTGVLARRPEVRSRLRKGAVRWLVEAQRRLVDDAMRRLPGVRRLVYSTCSLLEAENERMAEYIASRYGHLEQIGMQTTLPQLGSRPRSTERADAGPNPDQADAPYDCDGGFVAVFTAGG